MLRCAPGLMVLPLCIHVVTQTHPLQSNEPSIHTQSTPFDAAMVLHSYPSRLHQQGMMQHLLTTTPTCHILLFKSIQAKLQTV
jgi:hypothetical protein